MKKWLKKIWLRIQGDWFYVCQDPANQTWGVYHNTRYHCWGSGLTEANARKNADEFNTILIEEA